MFLTIDYVGTLGWIAILVLLAQADATSAMNKALSFMYTSGFWLHRTYGMSVAKQMQCFLCVYQRCAHAMFVANKNRFSLVPKTHYMAHIALEMRRQAETHEWILNPLSRSVQVQEDFIGRPSRVSRRVDIRRVHRTVMLRCLILSEQALQKSDDDDRGMDAYMWMLRKSVMKSQGRARCDCLFGLVWSMLEGRAHLLHSKMLCVVTKTIYQRILSHT